MGREVVWKLKDYTEIHMRSAVYNILDGMEENEHIRVDREYDGWRVRFCNLHNFVIDGENSEWFSPFTQCTVLFFENCSNFEIRNLKIGKEKTEQSQDGSVLCESCDSIVMENVNLFGGISLVECYDIRLKNVCLQKSIQEESLIYVDSMICMENVEICNCYTEGAIIDTCGEKLDCQNVYIHDNQYRKNPNMLSTVGGIIWDRNEQLPWF